MSHTPDNFISFDPAGFNTVEATARYLGVSAGFLNKARVTGDGPPFAKFGHAVRYFGPTVDGWVASRTRRSTSDHTDGEAA